MEECAHDVAPKDRCADGGDHLEHIWPQEAFEHMPDANCICCPDMYCDAAGFYWLHYRVSPEES